MVMTFVAVVLFLILFSASPELALFALVITFVIGACSIL